MSSWWARTAIVLGVLAAAGPSTATTAYLAYQVGVRVGYLDGYSAAMLDHEMIGGVSTVGALGWIRAGDVEAALGMLETSVDGAVLAYARTHDVDLSRFEPRGRSPRTDSLFSRIGKYRRSHPSTFPDESVRKTIADTVEQAPDFIGSCKGPRLEASPSEPVQVADGEGK